jgi:TolA-binding protein
MISIRILTPICLVAASALMLAQTPPPAPPAPLAPPQAAAAPTPAPAPAPPAPGMHLLLDRSDLFDPADIADQVRASVENLDLDLNLNVQVDMDQVREQIDRARDKMELMGDDWSGKVAEKMAQAQEKMAKARDQFPGLLKGFAFAQQSPTPPMPPMAPMPGMPGPKAQTNLFRGRLGSVEGLYQRGLSALDGHRYDQALEDFTEVVTRGGTHVDGALYWKAYTLNKLGRRDDATAAIAELRKSYAGSHWLPDAQALEIEVKQSSGQKVSPESESNDELKLLALEGLAQSDPDRTVGILEKLLKGPQSPSLKKRAVYVLALSNSARSQQLLEQIARGNGANPDLQMTAIQYLGSRGKDANKSNVLFEIYNASSDNNVKRGVLSALLSNHDKDHLLQIAKTDKSPEMRQEAVRMLGSLGAQPEIWQLYQSETDPDVKRSILDYVSGSTDRLIEIGRTEKDAKLRRAAIQRLGSVKASSASDALVQIYGTEQDPQVKRTIIDVLYSQRNATALVNIGRKEQDLEMKKNIVRRLVDMKSPEATQFLEEILK